ncbi:MAG: O-acetylserine/cysteine exporter [Betaproteobacteria bacterium HGW-Betaproteobacteria-14]|nr:MAG: O-acetylserine/cysteine exporter [Betaproteobacteria bacterium HGW-Betaproteobacteria-14]
MPVRDLLLTLVVVLTWGVSFTVIKLVLNDVPPMLMGALRFLLSAFPAIFLVPRPRIMLRWWWAYGMTVGVGQLALLFVAIRLGMPAGAASVILQSQSFFTLIFAALLLGERWHWPQFAGLTVAAVGIAMLAGAAETATSTITLRTFALTLGAAAFWGLSNVIVRLAADSMPPGEHLDPLAFLVWTSLIPPLPFTALSLWFDGPHAIAYALGHFSWGSLAGVAYLAFGGTLLGSGIFTALLTRHPSGRVAPFTLLVPLVGLATASLVLGERLVLVQWVGCSLVLFGLVVNMFGASERSYWLEPKGCQSSPIALPSCNLDKGNGSANIGVFTVLAVNDRLSNLTISALGTKPSSSPPESGH